MNNADQILRWHGSKRALAPKIIALFPKGYERMLYVEPFCGSASVFWSKTPSHCEVLNDLDGELVNFLVTVKMHSRELVRTLSLLPTSRRIFAEMFDRQADFSTIWKAARFCYLSHTSFCELRKYFASQFRSSVCNNLPKPPKLLHLRFRIFRWAKRLENTVLECAPWQEVVEKYDSPSTLFYIDPPYLATQGYTNPFGEADWHELAARLNGVKGKFVLSAEGTAKMKLMFRGYNTRYNSIISTFGLMHDRRQAELLVWNYGRL